MNITSLFRKDRVVAYFSMEIAVQPDIPTYSGGLGVLAGDLLRAAADLNVPLVGVTLVYRQGYMLQHLDTQGNQTAESNPWHLEARLQRLPVRVSITLEGRPIVIAAWQYTMQGAQGYPVQVYFLDTQLPENSPWDQTLTDRLYGGDQRYRLCQEAVLGMGGVKLLDALGIPEVQAYHMNEGHSALLALALLEKRGSSGPGHRPTDEDVDAVRGACIFTTHTPVPGAMDQFPISLANQVLGHEAVTVLQAHGACLDDTLNMAHLALVFSRYINGVSMRHEEISRSMFPGYPINSLSNGVHPSTWTSEPVARLFDRYIPDWRSDGLNLRYAWKIPLQEVLAAHTETKRQMIGEVQRRTGVLLDEAALTVGFGRRAAQYKRADLLFTKPEQLIDIVERVGPIQAVFSGNAHPSDTAGADVIRRVFQAAKRLEGRLRVVYVPNYDMSVAKLMCAGSDVWLNTPHKPYEASGTSGMKAALNGVPSLSILDGWWIEGCVDGVTGWSIGGLDTVSDPEREAASLYDRLEWTVVPLYYRDQRGFAEIMRGAISLNGSFFNSHRMLLQYVSTAYRSAEAIVPTSS